MRVSIARALVTQPKVLLLDEPFAALDDILRQELNGQLQRLWSEQKWTALFVTHNVSEAVFLSQRIIVLTKNPASVATVIEIPFQYPRTTNLRTTPEFVSLCERGLCQFGGGVRMRKGLQRLVINLGPQSARGVWRSSSFGTSSFESLISEIFSLPAHGKCSPKFAEMRKRCPWACLLTGRAAATGLVASVVAGTAIGFFFSQVSWLRRAFYPYAIFLQTLPIVAIAPILVLWIGNRIESVIAVSFILGLFPIVTNVTSGMMAIPTEMIELFQINRAMRRHQFFKLQFPFAVPYLLTGVKVAGGLAVIGAIVGEFFVGFGNQGKGLGYLIRQSVEMSRTPQLFGSRVSFDDDGYLLFCGYQ